MVSQYFKVAGDGRFELAASRILNIQNPKHLNHVINAVDDASLQDWYVRTSFSAFYVYGN